MSSCFIKVFRDYSRMSNVSGLYHNHISGAEPFIFLLIVKLIVNKHFRVPVNLAVFDIVRFKVKMTVWNIVRSYCPDECISDIFIYGTELTLFPRNILSPQKASYSSKRLSLMKGDKVIHCINIIANNLLLCITRPRNLDCFHTFYINTSAITYSINMRFQILLYKFFRPEIRVIKSRISSFSVKRMIRRANNSKGCSLFKSPFK